MAPGQTLDRPTAALALPIVPGLTGEWQHFMRNCVGDSTPDFAAECVRLGITRQTCYLQSTAQGDYSINAYEGRQLELLGKRLASPTGAFGTWGLAHAMRLTGFSPEAATGLVVPTPIFEFEAPRVAAGVSW